MKKIYLWYSNLSRRWKDSITISIALIGFTSTILSILGISFANIPNINLLLKILIILFCFVIISWIAYWILGIMSKQSIDLMIGGNSITIQYGDIFKTSGYKIIGCDTHFDTRIDDQVITKKSLHGQLFLNHGESKDIKKAVEAKAKKLNLQKLNNGLYQFPLGTVVRYDSKKDNQTYLMLAMINNIETNGQYKVTTSMSEYECMLMKMWTEIDGVYAGNDIVLPILGTGIARFENSSKDPISLLKCMLCTLNSSGVTFNSKVKILIYGNPKDIPLYELKDISRRILVRSA